MRAVLPESYSALYIKCTVRLLRIAKKNALFNVRFLPILKVKNSRQEFRFRTTYRLCYFLLL